MHNQASLKIFSPEGYENKLSRIGVANRIRQEVQNHLHQASFVT